MMLQKVDTINNFLSKGMTTNLYAPNAELALFYTKFKELDAIYQADPTPSENFTNKLYELDQAITAIKDNIPEEFIKTSQILPKALHMISLISPETYLLFHRLTYLVVYLLKLSDEAVLEFCQTNPKDLIIQLFIAAKETLPPFAFCIIKDLLRTNSGKEYLIESNFISAVFELIGQQMNSIPANGVFPKINLQSLLQSLNEFTTKLNRELVDQMIGQILALVTFLFSHQNPNISDLQFLSLRLILNVLNQNTFPRLYQPELLSLLMNHLQNPQLANSILIYTTKIIIIANQIDPNDKSILDLIPYQNAVAIFYQAEDPSLIQNLLTLFTNSLPFKPELIDLFTSEAGLTKLGQLIEMANSGIQQTTVWCVWNLLRFSTSQQMCIILNSAQLMELVVEISFVSDDFTFWFKILVPSIIHVVRSLTDLNFKDQSPYAEFLTFVHDSLIEMEETENVEIKSLAASCLTISFPEDRTEE